MQKFAMQPAARVPRCYARRSRACFGLGSALGAHGKGADSGSAGCPIRLHLQLVRTRGGQPQTAPLACIDKVLESILLLSKCDD
jgi:hypothetical protein